MKKLTHILITLTFAFACLGLWAMLTVLVSVNHQHPLPGFTRLCLGLKSLLLMLPVPVVLYCLYAVLGRHPTEQSNTTFLALTMSALCLVFFPVLMAVFLPCLKLMER